MVKSMRALMAELIQEVEHSAPFATVYRGQFDNITVTAPACIIYVAPQEFNPVHQFLRQGIGYVYCLGEPDAETYDSYLNSISLAEQVENCLLTVQGIETVQPAQPLQGLTYKSAVMVTFTFHYCTEEYYHYLLESENADA